MQADDPRIASRESTYMGPVFNDVNTNATDPMVGPIGHLSSSLGVVNSLNRNIPKVIFQRAQGMP